MFARRNPLFIFFLAFLALRAMVPVGYMLQGNAPGDAPGLTLTLCPTQNAQLDLSALDNHGHGEHTFEHHHGIGDERGVSVDASSGCQVWLNSLSVAVPDGIVAPNRYARISVTPPVRNPVLNDHHAYARPHTRAPPRFV